MINSDKGVFHVVDRNAFIRKFLGGLIESNGYQVQVFTDAEEYHEYLSSKKFIKPLATFVDASTPSNLMTIGAIQAIEPAMKFVFMDGERDIRSDFKHLACMYLRKPLNPTGVEEALNKLRKCHLCGASTDYSCSSSADEGFYEVAGWVCPSLLATPGK